jgi:hypothetical protein
MKTKHEILHEVSHRITAHEALSDVSDKVFHEVVIAWEKLLTAIDQSLGLPFEDRQAIGHYLYWASDLAPTDIMRIFPDMPMGWRDLPDIVGGLESKTECQCGEPLIYRTRAMRTRSERGENWLCDECKESEAK